MFNNRLTGTFDAFIRYTDDMVGPAVQLPATLGLNPPSANNCDLKTYGWELTLAWRDRTAFGLNYGVSFNLSDARTYIRNYPAMQPGLYGVTITAAKSTKYGVMKPSV